MAPGVRGEAGSNEETGMLPCAAWPCTRCPVAPVVPEMRKKRVLGRSKPGARKCPTSSMTVLLNFGLLCVRRLDPELLLGMVIGEYYCSGGE